MVRKENLLSPALSLLYAQFFNSADRFDRFSIFFCRLGRKQISSATSELAMSRQLVSKEAVIQMTDGVERCTDSHNERT